MKMIIFCLSVLLIAIFLQACKEPQKPLERLSASEIFEKFRKNVVLIKNKSFFKITFDDNSVAYFTEAYEDDDEGLYSDLTFDENEAKQKASYTYGTGFFINSKGIIATNLHVVSPPMSEGLIKDVDYKKSITLSLAENREQTLNQLAIKVAVLNKYHPEDSSYLSTAVPANLLNTMPPVKDGVIEENTAATKLPVDSLNMQVDSLVAHDKLVEELAIKDFKITVETVDLSISLDGSTGNDQEYPCHIYSLSNDKNVDLALIQTDGEALPLGITDGINIVGSKGEEYGAAILDGDTLKVATPLYLIGYNYGPEIAKTTQGIKVQLTKGEVTQENDKYRVLYSIPALPGSSGSPVFDSYGNVVAIHYCGLRSNENFNYGLLSFYLRNLINAPQNLQFPL